MRWSWLVGVGVLAPMCVHAHDGVVACTTTPWAGISADLMPHGSPKASIDKRLEPGFVPAGDERPDDEDAAGEDWEDDSGADAALPEFALEYDVDRVFGKSYEWTAGIRASVGYGSFDADGMDGQHFGTLENQSAEQLVLNVDWHVPVRRELSPFGFYMTAGLTARYFTWAARLEEDITALTLAPRVAGGYGLNHRQWMVDIGIFFEYGLVQPDDFEWFGRVFEGQLEDYFAAGLECSLIYNFLEGRGPELGIFGQVDHRRVRLGYKAGSIISDVDLARGFSWVGGVTAGYRF